MSVSVDPPNKEDRAIAKRAVTEAKLQAATAIILIAGIPLAGNYFLQLRETDKELAQAIKELEQQDHQHEIEITKLKAQLGHLAND